MFGKVFWRVVVCDGSVDLGDAITHRLSVRIAEAPKTIQDLEVHFRHAGMHHHAMAMTDRNTIPAIARMRILSIFRREEHDDGPKRKGVRSKKRSRI